MRKDYFMPAGGSRMLQTLKVSENRRFLIQENGEPFFWLGDTAWELFHKTTREDAELYLRKRAEQGFTVVQAVALAELEGITTPNAYGRLPLRKNDSGRWDPSLPDVRDGEYDYWRHVDYIVDLAAELGIYIALLPTWGDKYHLAWGKGPVIFDETNARAYGRWLGERYKDRPNVVWVLGGDRALTRIEHFLVVRAIAEGLRAGDGGRHLIGFHPKGGESSSHHVHDESWLDFNMIQSGHGIGERENYLRVRNDYTLTPVKPTLDAEPCYEDHPIGFDARNGYFDEADVRKAAYYAVFSGAFGHTYGHHSVWCMSTGQFRSVELKEPGDYIIMHWKTALLRPGASQMRHLRTLMESRPALSRVPDQSLLADNYAGSNYMAATRGEAYAFVYIPNGLAANVVLGKVAGTRVNASWFDPRTGSWIDAGERANEGAATYVPPSAGRGNDWVLVLDGVEA